MVTGTPPGPTPSNSKYRMEAIVGKGECPDIVVAAMAHSNALEESAAMMQSTESIPPSYLQ